MAKLNGDVRRVIKMKFDMLEKIKVLLDEGIAEVIQSRYVDNKLVAISEE
jgi:hypothetical protein